MKAAPVLKAIVISLACAGVAGADNKNKDSGPVPLTVPKAVCGPGDRPETALQGQVPAAMRASGFKGFNCNLQLVGQVRGDGANWQTTQFKQKLRGQERHGDDGDEGKIRVCGYHGTASAARSLPGRTNFGVRAVDLTNPGAPAITAYLDTPAMHDPWESLKVNERRQLLVADNGQNGGGGPEIDVYDLSDDCRTPQLLASAPVGTGADGGIQPPLPAGRPVGHEGAFAPDGLTYYVGDTTNRHYHAVDVSDPTRPKMIATLNMASHGLAVHGLSVSKDGRRAYVTSVGNLGAAIPGLPDTNGFVILDTSEVQARKPNAQMKIMSTFLFKDGSAAQHTIPVRIKGKPYVIHVDELGSGGIVPGWQAACAANQPPFALPRIVDISDEKNPKLVSRIMLETNNPANCSQVLPDLVGLSVFTYDSHYCSVDNKDHATTLACGMFNSGVRVFDIRDPQRVKEIAYYNPAGTVTASPGSNHHAVGANWKPGAPDWCSAQVHLDAKAGTLWTTCQDNGVLMLKFTNGVWPFPDSRTPPGGQN